MLQYGSPFKLCSRGRDSVAFCGRISALGRWNLQLSWFKCPGVPQGQLPGMMAADMCINMNKKGLVHVHVTTSIMF